MTTQLAQPETTRARHDNVDPTAPGSHQRDAFASRVTATDLGAAIHRWLDRHSITLLRISMGTVIFGFGILKYFPGVSPAENLILTSTHLLTFGLVPGRVAMVLLATVECAIGLSLITSRGLRVTIYLLVMWVLGILSPAVLLPGRLFSGPDHAPTLEGQYVLKDIILLTASLVIAAATLRRAKTDTP
jgi:putative oxidoreductase